MNLTEKIAEAKKLIHDAATEAASLVKKSPDNPAIKRLGGSASTASFKDLGNNWSPFFHDWAAQYRTIGEMLESERFSAIQKILESKKSHEHGHFADEVVERVRSIVGDLVTFAEPSEAQASEPTKRVGRRP